MAKAKYILYYTVMEVQYDTVILYGDNIFELVKYAYGMMKYDNELNVAITLTDHFERGAWDNLFELRDGDTIINSRTKKCSDYFNKLRGAR